MPSGKAITRLIMMDIRTRIPLWLKCCQNSEVFITLAQDAMTSAGVGKTGELRTSARISHRAIIRKTAII
jgi:hypothetical protein